LPAYNAAKCNCGRGSAPTPLGELAYGTPQIPYLVLRGRFVAGGKGAEGEGKGGEGQEWRGRGGWL